jgi:hypothetical protein
VTQIIDARDATFGISLSDWGAARTQTGTVIASSSTSFTVQDPDGLVEVYSGTDFDNFNASGIPQAGTITGYVLETAGGAALLTVTGASTGPGFIDVLDGTFFNFGLETAGLGSVIYGSNYGDTWDFGSGSIIHGGAGDDTFNFIDANSGGEIDGGGGFNTLRLQAGSIDQLNNITLSSIQQIVFADGDQSNETALADFSQLGSGLANDLTIVADSGRDALIFTGTTPGTYDFSQFTFTNWTNTDHVQIEAESDDAYHLIGPNVGATLIGGGGDVILQGGSGNDVLIGNGGNDTLNGGGGSNTASFDFLDPFILTSDQTTWSRNPDGSWTVQLGAEGVETLIDIQSLRFSDRTIHLPSSFTALHDFYGVGPSDLLFGQSDGELAIWQMNGTAIIGGGDIGNPGGTWAEAGIGTFAGGKQSGILFQDANHDLAIWDMSGTSIVGGGDIGNPGGTWSAAGVGDFNRDGNSDILFRDDFGNVAIWEMNGTSIIGGGNIGNPGGTWAVDGVGDFDGNFASDILFQDAAGNLAIWEMNGTNVIGGGAIGNPGAGWNYVGLGDFNADSLSDILFKDTSTGDYAIWEMNGTQIIGGGDIGNPGGSWQFAGIGDYNGDGHSDILFSDATGDLAIWEMSGTAIIGGGEIGSPGSVWRVLG